jgi:hypothetical protein
MHMHDGYAPHSHEVRPDHDGVKRIAGPVVVDTAHFMRAGQRLDLDGLGPWTLTGYDTTRGRDITTEHEGPLDQVARSLLTIAYPGVATWNASPQHVDETHRNTEGASRRIRQLLGVSHTVARAILTIAADDVLGHKFTHGQWEVTGDDDDQSFRIRSVKPDSREAFVRDLDARADAIGRRGRPPEQHLPAYLRIAKTLPAGSAVRMIGHGGVVQTEVGVHEGASRVLVRDPTGANPNPWSEEADGLLVVKAGSWCEGADGECDRDAIRTTAQGQRVCAGHDPGEDLVDWSHVPMACTNCGQPVVQSRPGGRWRHTDDGTDSCKVGGGLITARVDA